MAFTINKIASGHTPVDIQYAIDSAFAQSRFTYKVLQGHGSKVTIQGIRLKEAKDYCGNHPLACPVRPGVHKPHKHFTFLEGADWVAFNDMLNDVLDKLKVEANVASSHVIIRKAKQRCVEYKPQTLSNGIDSEWVKDSGRFANRMGRISLRSKYPIGTPGIPEWKNA